MRSKITVVLLFLNVVLFYYIYRFERVALPDADGRHILGKEVSTIDSLTRTARNGETVKVERNPQPSDRSGGWTLTQPYVWPANPNAVNRIVNELRFLEYFTRFPVADLAKSGQTLADYGLDQPAVVLSFTSAGQSYTLKIGDSTRVGNRLYVLSPDGERINVVSRSLADSIGLPLSDLRAENVFSIPVFEVRSLNVQTAAPSNLKVRLRRDAAARWSFETPILARAAKNSVEVTINALNSLTVVDFLEPRDTDLERAGLNSPAYRVTLEGNARRETLLLGNPAKPAAPATPSPAPAAAANDATAAAGTEFFAKIEDKAVVFTVKVPDKLLEVLRTAQETLRDPDILDFEAGTVTAVTLAVPGQPELTLQRLEGDAGWQAVVRIAGQAPVTTAADTALVNDLLKKLDLLSARRFVSDAPSAADVENYGFNRPEREITLNLTSGGGPRGNEPSTVALQIGVSPDRPGVAFARLTNAPFVYEILPDILADTPGTARHYRQRLLRELPAGTRITGIALTRVASGETVYAHRLAENEKDWDAALAAEPEARRHAVSALLGALRTLRAARFTADTFTPDRADTPDGPRPWTYRLDCNLAFPGGNGGAPNTTSTLFLTDRLGGGTQLAGTAEFGGVVFAVGQDLLDALFALTYAEKNDPGVPAPEPAPAPAPTPGEAKAPPAGQP
jgi:hypothetical protein